MSALDGAGPFAGMLDTIMPGMADLLAGAAGAAQGSEELDRIATAVEAIAQRLEHVGPILESVDKIVSTIEKLADHPFVVGLASGKSIMAASRQRG